MLATRSPLHRRYTSDEGRAERRENRSLVMGDGRMLTVASTTSGKRELASQVAGWCHKVIARRTTATLIRERILTDCVFGGLPSRVGLRDAPT